MADKKIFGCVSPETAQVVENYPYGFRLRTSIRYWIESNKRGDRFVSQTLNPKTQNWNAPKASTYCEVMVMVQKEENGYISYREYGVCYTGEEELKKFLDFVGEDYEKLNDFQKEALKMAKAILETRKHIKFKIRETTNETEEERTAHEAEQKEVKTQIHSILAYHYARA